MKSKKVIAALCALAVVVSSSGGLPLSGLRLFDTAIVASAESTNETIDFSAQGYDNLSYATAVNGTDCTITFDKGAASFMRPTWYDSGNAVRFYAQNTMTVSSASKTITKIELTFGRSDGSNEITTDCGNFSVNTWTGSSDSVTFTIGGTSGHRRIQALKVTVENAAVPATNISTATVNLAADNSVASIKVGDDTITDLSGFSITYGTDDSHTATAVPTEAGTYYAYVTPKDTNTAYTGTAKSAAFTVAAAATDPAYTITIPATVDLKSTDPVEITASGVTLNEGQKIVVTLDSASNTASGSEFSVKDKSGESTVNYTIKAGDTDVAVGDTVAEFETKTGEQSATLTFTKDADSTPTFAGKHTETLTFGVSLEDAVTAPTLAGVTLTDGMIIEPHCTVGGEDNWVQFKYVADDNKFVPNFNTYSDVYSKSGGSIMQPLADQWAWSTFYYHEDPDGNFYLTQTGNTVHLRADDGIDMLVIDLQLDFDNMTYTQLYKEWYNTVSGSFTSIKIGDTTITASQMTAN